MLQDRLEDAKQIKKAKVTDFLQERWEGFRPAKRKILTFSPNTGYPKKEIVALGHKVATLPEGKKYFRKIVKLLKDRVGMLETNTLDWGMAEMLAYATLLEEGYPSKNFWSRC